MPKLLNMKRMVFFSETKMIGRVTINEYWGGTLQRMELYFSSVITCLDGNEKGDKLARAGDTMPFLACHINTVVLYLWLRLVACQASYILPQEFFWLHAVHSYCCFLVQRDAGFI